MQLTTPIASIVIPTFNGRKKILQCLTQITQQLICGLEVIVVVDGSNDGTTEAIRELFPSNPYLSVIETPNQGRSVSRNIGARVAKGQILIFLDDDIEIGPHFVSRHIEIHASHPSAWVTGLVTQKVIDVAHKDFLLFRRTLESRSDNIMPQPVDLLDVDSFSTQQLSVRKDDFIAVGGFSSALRDTEDFELSVRVKDAGYSIILDRRNEVYHCDFAEIGTFIDRQVQYRTARLNLANLNPVLATRYPGIFKPKIKNSPIYLLIRRFFIYNCFWNVFVKNKLRRLIPRRILFLIFDLIISSTVISRMQQTELKATLKY